MNIYRLTALLLLVAFSLPSQLVAQNQKEGFDSLYTKFKIKFDEEKYNEALSILNSLNQLLTKAQEVKSSSAVESHSKEFEDLFSKAITPAKFNIGKKTIKVHFGSKILYIIKNDPLLNLIPLQLPIEYKGKLAVENKYLKIDDQTKIVKFASNNENILTIDAEGSLKVNKGGRVIITVSVDGNFVQIPLKVIEIPLTKGMSRDRVIEVLGISDELNKKYIPWVKTAYVDDIFYSATTGTRGYTVEHWIYNKYPKAILTFNYSGLSTCVMASWKKLSGKMYALEHK